jgi:transposase
MLGSFRRKFLDIQQAHSSPLAAEALKRIAELYVIEREIRGRSPDERKQVRKARLTPLVPALQEWMQNTLTKLLRKSDTAGAIA